MDGVLQRDERAKLSIIPVGIMIERRAQTSGFIRGEEVHFTSRGNRRRIMTAVRNIVLWAGIVVAPLVAMAMPTNTSYGAAANPAAEHGSISGSTLVSLGHGAIRMPYGASMVGAPPSSNTINMVVSLAPKDPSSLSRFVQEVSTPGSPGYRHYLTVHEFAVRFGQPIHVIDTILKRLRSQGLYPGLPSKNHLSIPVSGALSKVSKAFHVKFDLIRLRSGRIARFVPSYPKVPYTVSNAIQGVMGLSTVNRPLPQLVPVPISDATATAPPQACSGASSTKGYTPQLLSQGYNLGHVYSSGGDGAGQTVGLVELGAFSSSDIATYEKCYGVSTAVNVVPVDGGGTLNANTNEATSDVENIIGMVPDATVDAYVAPDTGTGYYDAIQTSVDDNKAQVISISYGNCEQVVGISQAQAEETLFEQAASQGQTVLAAAGDTGSSGCYVAGASHPDTSLAVKDPASDPYVTGVGGTDLSSLGSPRTETVWNNNHGEGGGGGISAFWPMPSWQSAPGVVNQYSSGNPCGASSGYCREVPDVSANASVGYPMYCTAGGCNNIGWELVAGTSMATPLWASIITMANQLCGSGPLGFINPSLYKLATDDSGAFYDITSGDNDATGTNNGLYPATIGYDMASGIGTPNGAVLVPALCSLSSSGSTSGIYQPITPTRICDTRSGNPSNLSGTALTQCEGKPLGPAGTLAIKVVGVSGIPSSATTAYMNVTAVGATAPSYLTLYPAGTSRPVVSSLNLSSAAPVSNLVAVPLPSSGTYAGSITIYNNAGSTNVIVDVEGYTEDASTSSTGGQYVALTSPIRVLDTRCSQASYYSANKSYCNSLPLANASLKTPQAGESEAVSIGGVGSIPDTASAVVVNQTVATPGSSGYFTVYPDGQSRPVASSLNWVAGETRANQTIVGLGANGYINLFSSSVANAVLDVSGYYAGSTGTSSTTGSDSVAISPVRICDTRSGNPSNLSGTQAQCNGHTLTAGQVLSVKVAEVGNVPSSGVTAVALNLTALGETATTGYLSVDPATTPPQTSDLNWDAPSSTVPNFVIATLNSSGDITIYNGSSGSVNVLVDLYEYFTGS